MKVSETPIQMTFAHVTDSVVCQVRHSAVTIDVCSPRSAFGTLTGAPA